MKYNRDVHQALAMLMQCSINMLVPIFICLFVGMFLDDKLNTNFIAIILFFLGAAAGFRNIIIMARAIYEEKGKDDHQNDGEASSRK